ncbi:MAG: hypothetical protein IT200_12100 [Thermoleophilia bacterium]|nr:hypothetical protein [Thermoleophilia bacterium]
MDAPPLDPAAAEALRAALRALRRAGDLVERVSHPGGAARSPHPEPLAFVLFAALSGIADGERHLTRALELADGAPPPD